MALIGLGLAASMVALRQTMALLAEQRQGQVATILVHKMDLHGWDALLHSNRVIFAVSFSLGRMARLI